MDLLSAALLKKGLSSWELTAYLLPNSHLGRDGASWATSWVMSCSGATVKPSGASRCSLLTHTHKGEWWRTQSYDGHGHSDFSKNGPPVPGSALYNSSGLVGGKAPFPGSLQGHLEVTGLCDFPLVLPFDTDKLQCEQTVSRTMSDDDHYLESSLTSAHVHFIHKNIGHCFLVTDFCQHFLNIGPII